MESRSSRDRVLVINLTFASGGYGTKGENGANGGVIEVTVREEDMNLLIAVEYNIAGGRVGPKGAHGHGGKEGDGSPGGASCSW